MRFLFYFAASVLSAAVAAEAIASAAVSKAAKKPATEDYSTSNRVGCVANLNGYHFNLKELSLPIDEKDRTKSTMYELDYQNASGTSTIQFNLCEETARRCPDLMPDHANMVNAAGTCNHLSKVVMEKEPKPGSLSLISEQNPQLGVVMSFEGGNMCTETEHYSLQVQINCNANLEKTTFALDKESLKTPCAPRVIMNSPHACPVISMGPLGDILANYGYWIGAPMIAIGAYFAFVAGQFPGVTLLIFTTLAVSLAQLFALYMFVLPSFIPTWTVLIVFSVTLGMGAGLGFGALKWPKIGIVVMGLSIGALLGFMLYYTFLASSVNSTVAKVVTIASAAILTGIMTIVLFDHMVIVTSAVFGAYTLVRGISMYTGGYVNEFEVILANSNGDIGQVQWTTFFFWGLMVVMAIVGVLLQLGNRTAQKEAFNDMNFQTRQNGMSSERVQRLSEQMSARSLENSMAGDDENRPLNGRNV